MSIRQLKFVVKHTLRRGPVLAWWHWVSRSRRIFRWRNPWSDRPLEAVPVHVLTGADQLHMALWMLASFTQQTKRNWRILLHDDGTLPADSTAIAARLGLHARHVTKPESDERIRAALQPHPACLRHYEAFFMAQKFYGPLVFADSEKHFVLDTDILYFAFPAELMRWVDSADGEMWFNRDLSETCQLPAGTCRDVLGFELWPHVNAGLACIHNPSLRLRDTERFLEQVELLRNADQWMLEQTLYALHASMNNKGGILPPQYELSLSAARRSDAVCRHYVGAVRDRFYTEGIREAARELGVSR